MLNIPERIGELSEVIRKSSDKLKFDLRVCCPGIIKSFDPEKLTCTVQLAIRERLNFSGNLEWVDVPILPDVPVVITGTADYFVTFPIVEGTECIVVFADNCIDAWWQNGGVQNQVEKRRHDLSDGFAIIGPRCQQNLISNYNMSGVEVRDKSGSTKITLAGSDIHIQTTGSTYIGAGDVVINSRVFMDHQHSGVTPGGGNTGGVV